MNIAFIGFLDTSAMTATYVTRHRLKPSSELVLRANAKPLDDGEIFEDSALLKEWKTARAVLTRAKTIAAAFLKSEVPDLGLAFIDVLKPGAFCGWAIDDREYAKAFIRLRLCLIPSSGAWTYSGGESAIIPVGQLTFVNTLALSSEINVGPCSRVHLVMDIRRPDPP